MERRIITVIAILLAYVALHIALGTFGITLVPSWNPAEPNDASLPISAIVFLGCIAVILLVAKPQANHVIAKE